MTAAAIDHDADLLAWTGMLRVQHERLNDRCFDRRLSDPIIEWVELEAGTHATYGHRRGEPILRFSSATIRGVPFLGGQYATSLRRVRLLETLKHELAHQAADELYGQPPTGDDDLDHAIYGFPLASRPHRHPGSQVLGRVAIPPVAMTLTVQQVAARLSAEVDQRQARVRDLERLLQLLRPLADWRGPAWWVLRRLPSDQRAEVAELRARLRLGR